MSEGELFPTDFLKECSFTLVEQQSQPGARSNSGKTVVYGDPYWKMRCRYENLTDAAFRKLSAFLARRQGAGVSFRAYRTDRPAPIKGAAFNVKPEFDASPTEGTAIRVKNAVGRISEGDMVSYLADDATIHLAEVTSVQEIEGGVSVLGCWPYPVTPYGDAPSLSFIKPTAEFKMIGGYQIGEPYDGRRSVSFEAEQITRDSFSFNADFVTAYGDDWYEAANIFNTLINIQIPAATVGV